MAAPHISLFDAKREGRTWAMAARAGCDPRWGVWLAGHVLESVRMAPNQVVAGFWPLDGEIDVRPLLLALAGRGHGVCLPVTPKRGLPLTFSRWTPGETLARGRFGTSHPSGPEMTPTLLLVPLLAFDRAGRRLGYGAGYYDRTLTVMAGLDPGIHALPTAQNPPQGRALGFRRSSGPAAWMAGSSPAMTGWRGLTTIGCAFAAQEMQAVPAGPTDIPLHAIATERGIVRIP